MSRYHSSVVERWWLKLNWIPDTACFFFFFLPNSNITESWINVSTNNFRDIWNEATGFGPSHCKLTRLVAAAVVKSHAKNKNKTNCVDDNQQLTKLQLSDSIDEPAARYISLVGHVRCGYDLIGDIILDFIL